MYCIRKFKCGKPNLVRSSNVLSCLLWEAQPVFHRPQEMSLIHKLTDIVTSSERLEEERCPFPDMSSFIIVSGIANHCSIPVGLPPPPSPEVIARTWFVVQLIVHVEESSKELFLARLGYATPCQGRLQEWCPFLGRGWLHSRLCSVVVSERVRQPGGWHVTPSATKLLLLLLVVVEVVVVIVIVDIVRRQRWAPPVNPLLESASWTDQSFLSVPCWTMLPKLKATSGNSIYSNTLQWIHLANEHGDSLFFLIHAPVFTLHKSRGLWDSSPIFGVCALTRKVYQSRTNQYQTPWFFRAPRGVFTVVTRN